VPRLHVLAVANRLPAWAAAARDEYLRRMPRGYEVELLQLRPRISAKGSGRKFRAMRGLVALDERGKDLSTKHSRRCWPTHRLVIGGADGLDPAIRKGAACCCACRR
jgi:23S rRNA (pseudouridine1915-N3)-methyltransferase